MKKTLRLLFILTTVFAASCSRTGIVSDVPVKFVRPEVTVSQPCDTAFNCLFPEVGRSYDLQIVDDTVWHRTLLKRDGKCLLKENRPFYERKQYLIHIRIV